jgi:hypothetical protein
LLALSEKLEGILSTVPTSEQSLDGKTGEIARQANENAVRCKRYSEQAHPAVRTIENTVQQLQAIGSPTVHEKEEGLGTAV